MITVSIYTGTHVLCHLTKVTEQDNSETRRSGDFCNADRTLMKNRKEKKIYTNRW